MIHGLRISVLICANLSGSSTAPGFDWGSGVMRRDGGRDPPPLEEK